MVEVELTFAGRFDPARCCAHEWAPVPDKPHIWACTCGAVCRRDESGKIISYSAYRSEV